MVDCVFRILQIRAAGIGDMQLLSDIVAAAGLLQYGAAIVFILSLGGLIWVYRREGRQGKEASLPVAAPGHASVGDPVAKPGPPPPPASAFASGKPSATGAFKAYIPPVDGEG